MKHFEAALHQLQSFVKSTQDALRETFQAIYLDDKTPLKNALALNHALGNIGRKPNESDAIVFGDLNRFKRINDQFGHAAGDAAITQAGHILHTLFVLGIKVDAFRKSGDEFVVILPKSKLPYFQEKAGTFGVCEALFEDKTIQFSMSFGVACTDDQGAPSSSVLMERAELACQQAKEQGDGICVTWTPELEQQQLESLRIRCNHCNTTISCSVPKKLLPPDRKLQCCPVCKGDPYLATK